MARNHRERTYQESALPRGTVQVAIVIAVLVAGLVLIVAGLFK